MRWVACRVSSSKSVIPATHTPIASPPTSRARTSSPLLTVPSLRKGGGEHHGGARSQGPLTGAWDAHSLVTQPNTTSTPLRQPTYNDSNYRANISLPGWKSPGGDKPPAAASR
jgi:hypothetical protein